MLATGPSPSSSLQHLPPEILQHIVDHLSASTIVNLCLTNKKLLQVISIQNPAIYKSFVQDRFPSVKAPPFWREASCALTNFSRAWRRRGIIATECVPPRDLRFWPQETLPYQPIGYRPAIDSYETWYGSTWADRRDVLVWGAAGRLRLRINEGKTTRWSTWRTSKDHLPDQDILDIRLLRPHQNSGSDEIILLTRANGRAFKVRSSPEVNMFRQISEFESCPSKVTVNCTAVSNSQEPLMAISYARSIRLFPVSSDEELIKPASDFETISSNLGRYWPTCSSFISDQTIAVAYQSHEVSSPPTFLYDVRPTGLEKRLGDGLNPLPGTCTSALLSIFDTNRRFGNPGQCFLSGSFDGKVRLYDQRVDRGDAVATYIDSTDQGQVMSLALVGHEKVVAAGGQNALLKMFDLRMSHGPTNYSYFKEFESNIYQHRNTPTTQTSPETLRSQGPPFRSLKSHRGRIHRDFNIFLSVKSRRPVLWEPLPRQDGNYSRYKGSVYSLSSPSSLSSTVYAGIENHVLQLDFISTDDVKTTRSGLRRLNPSSSDTLVVEKFNNIINISCYDRPIDDFMDDEGTRDNLCLRKQVRGWYKACPKASSDVDILNRNSREEKLYAGTVDLDRDWDERWRVY